MALYKEINTIASSFPSSENFVLTSQLKRAALSICLNLAEGNSQLFLKKEINHFNISLGSCSETICALDVALQSEYITIQKYSELEAKLTEIQKMIIGYIRKLQESLNEEDDV